MRQNANPADTRQPRLDPGNPADRGVPTWTLSLEEARRRARVRSVLALVIGGGLFAALASSFGPAASSARDGAAASSTTAAMLRDTPTPPVLGELVGRSHIVQIHAAAVPPGSPPNSKPETLYTVLDHTRRVLATGLTAQDVYTAFPELDIENLQASQLMLAEPREP